MSTENDRPWREQKINCWSPKKLQQLVASWNEYEAETATMISMGSIPAVLRGFGRSIGSSWSDWDRKTALGDDPNCALIHLILFAKR